MSVHRNDTRTDVDAIKALIARQFASLNWTPQKPARWDSFAADFFPGATLYPAARPANCQAVQGFLEWMKDLAGSKMRSFTEKVSSQEIHVFGNVAVAVAACEMIGGLLCCVPPVPLKGLGRGL